MSQNQQLEQLIEINANTSSGGLQDVNITEIGGNAVTTFIPVSQSGSWAVDSTIQNASLPVTQSGSWAVDSTIQNASINTNATIQNASLPVTQSGSWAVDSTIQNASINTNATIQNGSLPVTQSGTWEVDSTIQNDVDVNLKTINNVTMNVGNGVANTGVQRVAICNNNSDIGVKNGDAGAILINQDVDKYQRINPYKTSLVAQFGNNFDIRFDMLGTGTSGTSNEFVSISTNGIGTEERLLSIEPLFIPAHCMLQIFFNSYLAGVNNAPDVEGYIGISDDPTTTTPQNGFFIGHNNTSSVGYDIRIIQDGAVTNINEGSFSNGSQLGARDVWNSNMIRFNNYGVSTIEFFVKSVNTGEFELIHRFIGPNMTFNNPNGAYYFHCFVKTNSATTARIDFSRLLIESNSSLEPPATLKLITHLKLNGTGAHDIIGNYGVANRFYYESKSDYTDIHKLTVYIEDTTVFSADEYGGGPALINGIKFYVFRQGKGEIIINSLETIKQNSDWGIFAKDINYLGSVFGAGNKVLTINFSLNGEGGARPLRLRYGERFGIIVEDNLTPLIHHFFTLTGEI